MDRGTCSSCGAEIYWIRSEKSGKPMPLDTTVQKRVIIVSSGPLLEGARVVDTYQSHFGSCPQADQHRKARP